MHAMAERDDGTVAPLSIHISQPDYEESRGYFCTIRCSFVRKKPFMVFGWDENQARELSYKFIRDVVLDRVRRVVDASGREIAFDEDAPSDIY